MKYRIILNRGLCRTIVQGKIGTGGEMAIQDSGKELGAASDSHIYVNETIRGWSPFNEIKRQCILAFYQ